MYGPAQANGSRIAPLPNDIAELLTNAMSMRTEWLKQFADPRKDIDDECGYPQTGTLTARRYRDMYDREPVATRVVQLYPKESWKVHPSVYEDEESEEKTEFETAWDELSKSLRSGGGKSWFQDEEGSAVWEYLRRADELAGIGHYGVLLLGLDDGQELREEATARAGAKLLYMRAFDESLADITRYENDPTSPRYGQPVAYNITFNDPYDNSGGVGIDVTTREVHWTRIIHLADNLGSSEVHGVPRMRPVWNPLHNIRKLLGGSAEMYWRGAFPGLSIETHPQLGGDVVLDPAAMRTQMEQYMNGLQRYLSLMGMTAKSLAPQVVDPTPQIEVQIQAICIMLGCPQRIFMGSERGELASSQDDKTWNERIADRQQDYITPRIIVPFIDRLITLGVLPEPEGYSVYWPDLSVLSDAEKADVALKRTQALTAFIGGNGEAVMTPVDYLSRVMGFSEEEAEAIVDAVMKMMPEDRLTEDPAEVRAEEAEMQMEQFDQQQELSKEDLKIKSESAKQPIGAKK